MSNRNVRETYKINYRNDKEAIELQLSIMGKYDIEE